MHLIANHNLWDFNQFSQFYKQLNWSYHDVMSNIFWCKRYCQWTTWKASTLPAASPCAARSLESIWHNSPHHKLYWAAVSTCSDECWRCGKPDHFNKDCIKLQANKPAQIKEIESWFDDQLSCQDFEIQYFSSSDNDDFSKNNLNISKNLYVS